MTNCILHIGAGKAGSSSIQRFLTNNRDTLLDNKILYPLDYLPNGKKGGDNQKSLAFISKVNNWNKPYLKRYNVNHLNDYEVFSKKVIEHFRNEVSNNEFDNLIISGEQFWSELTTYDDINKLKSNLLEIGLNVSNIIFYAREQVNWFNRFLHQKLREGSLRSVNFDLDLDFLYGRLNYFKTINTWKEVFNDVKFTVGKFEKESFKNSDLLYDFFHKSEIEFNEYNKLIDKYNSVHSTINRSTFSIEQCQAIAFFNKKIEKTGNYKPGILFGKNFSQSFKPGALNDKGFLIPKDNVSDIESLFNFSNKLFFDVYLPSESPEFKKINLELFPEEKVPDFNERKFYEFLIKSTTNNQ